MAESALLKFGKAYYGEVPPPILLAASLCFPEMLLPLPLAAPLSPRSPAARIQRRRPNLSCRPKPLIPREYFFETLDFWLGLLHYHVPKDRTINEGPSRDVPPCLHENKGHKDTGPLGRSQQLREVCRRLCSGPPVDGAFSLARGGSGNHMSMPRQTSFLPL